MDHSRRDVYIGFLVASLFVALCAVPTAVAAAQGERTLRGQVVCLECWGEQKDRKANPYGTDADMACALRCSKAGVPQALAVWEGDDAVLYVLEPTAPGYLDHVAKQVEVTGSVRSDGEKRFVKVSALKVLSQENPAAAAPATAAEVGDHAPEFSLDDLVGTKQSLASYRGRIVVLNFWATWCIPCRKEMPAFVAVQNEYGAHGVQVIAASVDEPDTLPQVTRFVRDRKLNFSVWTGATTDQMLAFGLGAELPGTVLIDQSGRIVAKYRGIVDEKELKKQIDALLEKQRAAPAA